MKEEIHLPSKEACSGCGVCGKVCPTGSISFSLDELDCKYPHIDTQLCIKCGACLRSCHICTDSELNYPKISYAGWNTSETERKTSASGGIAAAIYSYAIKNSIITYGVEYQIHKGARFIPVDTSEEVSRCKNSKYVESFCIDVFEDIQKYLKNKKTVIFIGLPCQVAALKKWLIQSYENLLTIDIICHGVAPHEYLDQHISFVEKKKRSTAHTVFFRSPVHGTEKHCFTILDDSKCFYKAYPRGKDTYHTGYHSALIYRENCYNCKYARPERIGDITIGDFSGLGRFSPWDKSKVGVSCVIVSTEKGARLIKNLVESSLIYCEERPLKEALEVEKQLIHPSIPHKNRDYFKREYARNRDFEKSARVSLRSDIVKFQVQSVKKSIRSFISKIIPVKIKKYIKRLLRR